jgi:hypothetical protein
MNIWSRLGISVAMVAMFCIIMLEAFQNKRYYDVYKWYICGGFLALGVVLFFIGTSINRGRRARYQQLKNSERDADQPAQEDEEEDGVDPSQPFLLVNLAYWGVMLVAFGIIIVFIVPTYKKGEPVKAREPVKTNAPVVVTNAVVVTNQPPVLKPPTIKLQGIVLRSPNSSVLINGHTFFVGDSFEDATLIEINPRNAVFDWNGKHITVAAPE